MGAWMSALGSKRRQRDREGGENDISKPSSLWLRGERCEGVTCPPYILGRSTCGGGAVLRQRGVSCSVGLVDPS